MNTLYLNKDDVSKLYHNVKSNFKDSVSCLVHLHHFYNVPKKMFRELNIKFADTTFRRRMKSFLKGDGEGRRVCYYFHFLFFIFFFLIFLTGKSAGVK
jgi:hypothetical protein